MNLKIATWNVNSLKVRLPHVEKWLATSNTDILALQEIKLQNHDFPILPVEAMGYHAYFSGQKTYNGVAFLSRYPLEIVQVNLPNFDDPQQRLIAALLPEKNLVLVCLYAPNGSSLDSDKFLYKQNWYAALQNWVKTLTKHYDRVILLGDYNIIPEEKDCYDAQLWNEHHILSSTLERKIWKDLCTVGPFIDAFRLFEPNAGHYSWWDYRQNQFQRRQGLRIDHILMTQNVAPFCQNVVIDPTPRTWERPSDHTPVVADFYFD